MPAFPDRPLMFPVDHGDSAVKKALPDFREQCKGKNVLYIELLPQNVEQVLRHGKYSSEPKVAAYQRLVLAAKSQGLRIVPLCKKEIIGKLLQANADRLLGKQGAEARYFFTMYYEREHMWLETLKRASPSSVIAMHPEHARSIAKALRIPKENIFSKHAKYKPLENLRAAWPVHPLPENIARARRIAKQMAPRQKRQSPKPR